MPPYRVYLISPDNHVAGAAHVIECEDDAAALAAAALFATAEHGTETWRGANLIGRFPAALKATPDGSPTN